MRQSFTVPNSKKMKRLAHTVLQVLKNSLLSLCVREVALLCSNHASLKAFFTFGTPKRRKGSLLTAYCLLFTAFCLLLPVHVSLSQSLPQWEHRALQYTRYNINKDFFSMNQPLQVSADGELLFSPEEDELYALRNTEVELLFKSKGVGIFQKRYRLLDNYFYGFSKAIYTGNSQKKFKLEEMASPHGEYSHFILIDKTIYFTLFSSSEKLYKLMSYDGKSFQEVERTPDPILAIPVNSVPYRCILSKGTTSLRSLIGEEVEKTFPESFFPIYMRSLSDFYFIRPDNDGLFQYNHTVITRVLPANKSDNKNGGRYYLYNDSNGLTLYDLEKQLSPVVITTAMKSASYNAYSEDSHSLYIAGGNQFYRVFTYLKSYPRLYNHTNTDGLLSIALTPSGKLWAGSYNGGFSVVDSLKTEESPLRNLQFANGALAIGEKVLFNTQQKGMYLFRSPTDYQKVSDTIVSTCNFLTSGRVLYTAVQGTGLAYKALEHLEIHTPWRRVTHKEGLALDHCQGIAEDSQGNIWVISMQGIARYIPGKDKAQTLFFDKKQTPIRGYAILKDSFGTLWFGTEKGQLYRWVPKGTNQLDPANFQIVNHPLFTRNIRSIVFLHQWRDYLIVGVSNRILVLSLSDFYKGEIRVRYLNPYAMNLQAPIEHTCVASRDSDDHIWFASSNMLFQWNIAHWLTLPNYSIEPTLMINTGKNSYAVRVDTPISLKADESSFDIRLHYQSKDNLPRYVNASLRKEDSEGIIVQGAISTDTEYRYQNLSTGNYIFSLTVCQTDGSYTEYEYPITIRKYFWKSTLFWVVIILIPILTGSYLLHNLRRMDRQDKEIALLTIGNLGKQFRPHFMLNALNSLGAELYGNPHAERILSHIGENISIMHRYSQDKTPFIPFEQEWKLTENTIAIQKEIFLPDLEVQVENFGAIPSDYRLPMGIVQVIVENSLLHGLRHRTEPPYQLRIAFWERPNMYGISISDNGIGVAASKKIAGVQRHGTGLKNIQRILNILDKHFDDAITITMTEKDKEDPKYPGTMTIIQLKKSINYEKISL